MTTVAFSYKNGELSYDSRQMKGDFILTDNAQKAKKVNGVWFITVGYTSDEDHLIDLYFGNKPNKKIKFLLESQLIAIEDGAVYNFFVRSNGERIKDKIESDCAWGSGSNFALAALDFGKTTKEAIEYASTRDNCTGGVVRTIIDLKKEDFLADI